jgi:hypothetical protein
MRTSLINWCDGVAQKMTYYIILFNKKKTANRGRGSKIADFETKQFYHNSIIEEF